MSQATEVLKMLRKAKSRGVYNYQFPQNKILCYTKRISELRAEGFNVILENVKLPNGRSTGTNRYVLIELIEEKKPWWKK